MNSGGNSDHDGDSNGRWLTYGEIAASRGTSRIAAVRLTQRHKWRRQMGNDGLARVLVPPNMLPDNVASHATGDNTGNSISNVSDVGNAVSDVASNTAGDVTDNMALLAAIEAAHAGEVAALRERAEVAERRADAADADRRAAQARAEHAEAARDAERVRADALRDRLNAQLVAAETTEAHAAALRDRLDAMQAQLVEAHAALQAAVETERRAAQAEQEIAGERTRADALRDRLDASQAQIAVAEAAAELARRHAQEAQDAAETLRQTDSARRALGLWARIRRAWRGE
jgi:hypothetical protein